ncbi:Phytochrome-like protein cph2 [compost metagenome]
MVQQILCETGLPNDRLELEITEETAVSHLDDAAWLIAELQLNGIMVTMDDFGTGYSSPGAVKRLPFDRMKIDRSFVSGLPNDRVDRAIIKSMLIVAESVGMKVVAEGIETAEQLAFLQECGCAYGQGYWYSRPIPLVSLKQLLSEKKPEFAR